MSYDRYETRRRTTTYRASSSRTTFGYWVPLVFTVTVATLGVAAWIWKERKENDDESYDGKDNRPPPGYGDAGPGQTAYAQGPPYQQPMGPPAGMAGPSGPPPGPQGPPPQGYEYQRQEEQGMMSRVTEVLRRTPSPQQILDEAGRRVTAGVAAAGAAVGSALGSIREEDRRDYEDHSRWSEEAVTQEQDTRRVSGPESGPPVQSGSKADKRRTVAIVVSAESQHEHAGDDVGYHQEHASILSHLPEHMDEDSKLFVLIFAPHLKQHPLASNGQSRPPPSVASSYSNIAHEEAQPPGNELERPLTSIDPQPLSLATINMYEALSMQARALVEKDSMIMPFTTPQGYIHMLRQIAPQIVYVQATLSGEHGEHVKNVSGWAGQVVLVVGDESGHGGLVDSEDERGAAGEESRQNKWWQHDGQVGLGQIEVVEGLRMGEDWRRRVKGHD